jgi:hypothetical protein
MVCALALNSVTPHRSPHAAAGQAFQELWCENLSTTR